MNGAVVMTEAAAVGPHPVWLSHTTDGSNMTSMVKM
jgi:hypothetical protein